MKLAESAEGLNDEDDLIPISALQHYVYCPRQCALIHVERIWEENLYTLRGRRAHERLELPEGTTRAVSYTHLTLPTKA